MILQEKREDFNINPLPCNGGALKITIDYDKENKEFRNGKIYLRNRYEYR